MRNISQGLYEWKIPPFGQLAIERKFPGRSGGGDTQGYSVKGFELIITLASEKSLKLTLR